MYEALESTKEKMQIDNNGVFSRAQFAAGGIDPAGNKIKISFFFPFPFYRLISLSKLPSFEFLATQMPSNTCFSTTGAVYHCLVTSETQNADVSIVSR